MRRVYMLALALLAPASCSSTAVDDGGAKLPGWVRVAELTTPRSHHSATVLTTGTGEVRVLIAGGTDADGTTLDSVEILDLQRSRTLPAPPMRSPRRGHAATLLSDGKVLVTGGLGPDGALDTTEVFDPDKGLWSTTLPMARARHEHAAVHLSGPLVLVTGGYADQQGTGLAACELYDEVTGTWMPTDPLARQRGGHTATLLPGQGVLAVGGTHHMDRVKDVALYAPGDKPSLGRWVPLGDLARGREGHAAAAVGDDPGALKVLVVGGESDAVELLDPVSRLLEQLTGLARPRTDHSLTRLPDGRALLVGGRGDTSVFDYLDDTLLFDVKTRGWVPGPRLTRARAGHRATPLPSGGLLISGGQGPAGLVAGLEMSGPFGDVPADGGVSSDADGTTSSVTEGGPADASDVQ